MRAVTNATSEVTSIERDLIMTVATVGGGVKARLLKGVLNEFWAQHPLDQPDEEAAPIPDEPVSAPVLKVIEGGDGDEMVDVIVPISETVVLKPPVGFEENMTEQTWRETLSDLLPSLPTAFSLDDLLGLSDQFQYLLSADDSRKQVAEQLALLVARGVLTKSDDLFRAVA